MLKVSFKESDKYYSKTVIKRDRETIVHLVGYFERPKSLSIAYCIDDCRIKFCNTEHCRIEYLIGEDKYKITSNGYAMCHENDKYDSTLGERIAESRAKYYIYRFMYRVCQRAVNRLGQDLINGDLSKIKDYPKGCILDDYNKYMALCIRESHHVSELLEKKDNGQPSN